MAYPPNAVFSVVSFLGFLLVLAPLPWHLQAWNIGTCAFMIWTALGCLNKFINSVIWNNSYGDIAPVWCDISTHLDTAINYSLPVSMLCISRRLFYLATSDPMKRTPARRRREILVDLALCILIPVVFTILCYIPQGNRYDIYETLGCTMSIYNTWVAVVILNCPPVIIACTSGFYSVRNIIIFRRRDRFVSDRDIATVHRNFTSSRYFRLILISTVDIIFTVPITAFVLSENIPHVSPWVSWADTHLGFEVVYVFPKEVWRTDSMGSAFEFERWLIPFSAFAFFGTIGLTREARGYYQRALRRVVELSGLSIPSWLEESDSGESLGRAAHEIDMVKTDIGGGLRSMRAGDCEMIVSLDVDEPTTPPSTTDFVKPLQRSKLILDVDSKPVHVLYYDV